MVHRIVGGLIVAAAAVTTLVVGSFLVKRAGGEEPLPPEEQTVPSVPTGSLGSVVTTVEKVQEVAPDFFIFETRFSNLANEEQTFDAIMQINDPNNISQVLKTERITVQGRSSRLVRFSTGNLFKLAVIRGIWVAEFFAWTSFQVPIILSETVTEEFIVDVL